MDNKTPATVSQSAPDSKPEVVVAPVAQAPVAAPAPRPKTIERQGVSGSARTERYPQVRGGICEFCGVLDPLVASTDQYKLCGHFKDIGQLRCSYCDNTKDPDDVIYHSVMNVAGHPDNPDKLVVWCDSFTCSAKHLARFQTNR